MGFFVCFFFFFWVGVIGDNPCSGGDGCLWVRFGYFFVDYYLCGFEWVKSKSVILCLGFHEWTSYFDLDYGIIVMLLGV